MKRAEQNELLPAIAHTFEHLLRITLRRGTLKGYRATDESSPVARGRIRGGDQIRRRHGTMLPLEITYDEFTVDTTENRLLRAATERLPRWPGVDPAVCHRLLHQHARLTEAARLVPGQPLPDWKPSRLDAHYQPALHLAAAILHGRSVEHPTGDVRTSGFLLDMNKLFEDFITVALQEALCDSDGDPAEGHLVHATGNAPHASHQVRHVSRAELPATKPHLPIHPLEQTRSTTVATRYLRSAP
ncbi:hypothetical protein [Kitasatospora sp. NPDC093806]|uniref:5-methylcytosine restriction system specificity protein McrC n=1 Tax=Kitasatospora sp. NPDC093806 TaxID=3155075 RepID=UPI003447BB2F